MAKISAIFTIVLSMCATRGSWQMEFTPQEIETGIMFMEIAKVNTAYLNWNVCYYYNLDEYFTLRDKLGNCINKMQQVCDEIEEKTLCKTLLEQLSAHSASMTKNEEMIESFEHFNRKKRALFEIIGKIYNAAFGLLDADDGRRYNHQIQQIQNKTLTNKDLIKQHTTILEANIHLHNETFHTLRIAIGNLTTEIKKLDSSQNNITKDIQYQTYFNTLATISTLIIDQQEKASKSIMTVLQNTLKGTIIDLVPLDKLEEDLRDIEMYLREDERLPVHLDSENLNHIFRIITAKANLVDRNMILQISVPILTTDSFQLIKTIPIPTKSGTITFVIQPTYPYFLLDIEHMRYIPMEEDELNNCKVRVGTQLICSPYSPIYKEWKEVCEMSLIYKQHIEDLTKICNIKVIPNANYVVPINRKNEYYCSIRNDIHVNNICGKTKQTTEYITQSGILKVHDECVVRTEKFDIKPHTEKFKNQTILLTPLTSPKTILKQVFNKYEENVMKKFQNEKNSSLVLIHDYKNDFDNLQKLIETEKKEFEKSATYDDLGRIDDRSNLSFTLQIIIIAIVIIGLVTAWKIVKGKIAPIQKALAITINNKTERQETDQSNDQT